MEQGAAISVSSDSLEDAGSLTVKADSIKLNEGNLTATTASGRGGDMNIQVQDSILMGKMVVRSPLVLLVTAVVAISLSKPHSFLPFLMKTTISLPKLSGDREVV